MRSKTIPAPQILVDHRILAGFKRRALNAYPLEHIESLWGKIVGRSVYVICTQPLDCEKASRSSLHVTTEDVNEDRAAAKESGLISLGDIHSHPDQPCLKCGKIEPSDCAPSEGDWIDLKENPHVLVFGIYSIKKNKRRRSTRIRFYFAQKLPVLKVVR